MRDIFFRFLIHWKLRIGVAQVQFRELFPSCQFFAEVIQRKNWILLQMGDSVRRKFVVSANSNLPVICENWHYYRGSPVRITHWLNHLRRRSSSTFLFSAYGTDLGLKNAGGWSLTTYILAVVPFSIRLCVSPTLLIQILACGILSARST